MQIRRSTFLKISSFASASFLVPKFLQAADFGQLVPKGNKVLVILQLSGGNDGLNTVIPINNDIYYKERPRIAIKKENALLLNKEAGLHPALKGCYNLFQEGNLAILNNVGYPNPDRSHFRSMDIWQTASESNVYSSTGWIGRYLDAQCKNCNSATALEMDDMLSLALKGVEEKGLSIQDPARLYQSSQDKFFQDIAAAASLSDDNPANYLYKTLRNTLNNAAEILKNSKQFPSLQSYPDTPTGNHLKTIASLIFSQQQTKVYYLSLGSFDTHIAQEGRHAQLLKEIDTAVSAFVQDLKKNHRFEDVLLMSFSEFGRRVAQNASNGTDHGTANNMFFISGGLQKKGLLNNLADLKDLDNGDLKHTIDFKNVYATVLHKWLDADADAILGKQTDRMDFL